MDSKWVFDLVLLLIFISIVDGRAPVFHVTQFGAVPDGKTDSARAFTEAWRQACSTNGGVLDVPKGTFFVSSAAFEGPCIGKTYFRIQGTVIASPQFPNGDDSWILFSHVDSLTIFGGGSFDGNGHWSWKRKNNGRDQFVQPTSITVDSVTNGVISGIKSLNSKMFHFQVHRARNLKIDGVQIIAPDDSPNTDGIHVAKSSRVSITNSDISTGDDCISIGDGTTNINISSINCGPGHGISIGSLGKYKGEEDVTGVYVSKSHFTNTLNALRIKTWASSISPTTISKIFYSDITVNNVQNPIVIDQHYCPDDQCTLKGESAIRIQEVKFARITGTSLSKHGVKIDCSKAVPCMDIEFLGLRLLGRFGTPTTANCSYVERRFLGSNQIPSHC